MLCNNLKMAVYSKVKLAGYFPSDVMHVNTHTRAIAVSYNYVRPNHNAIGNIGFGLLQSLYINLTSFCLCFQTAWISINRPGLVKSLCWKKHGGSSAGFSLPYVPRRNEWLMENRSWRRSRNKSSAKRKKQEKETSQEAICEGETVIFPFMDDHQKKKW